MRLPIFEAEVTILELSLDENDACRAFCPATEYPIDEGLVKIEKITVVDNPDNMTIEPYQEEDTLTVEFQYSARPAKLRYMPAATALRREDLSPEEIQPGILLTSQPVPIEEGYFVYEIRTAPSSGAEEQILQGLQEGMTLRAQITYITPEKGVIGAYQIIE